MPKLQIFRGGLFKADLNPVRGTEAGKVRPVLVVQSDLLNRAQHPSTWVLACTTRCTDESLLRVVLPARLAGNSQGCEVMIDQSRALDNRRLVACLGRLPDKIMSEVEDKLRTLAEL